MTRQEIDLAVEWAAREGWNPGPSDANAFHAADPEGFLIGRIEGEPVAVCSAVRHGAHFGFIGFYIVAPHLRGRGYGLQIWKAAMNRLQGRCIGLDGVIEQQHNYARSGFALAYRQVRYAGKVRPTNPAQLQPGVQPQPPGHHQPPVHHQPPEQHQPPEHPTHAARSGHAQLRELAAVPINDWVGYDRACFPSERRPYIEAWVSQPGTVAMACIDQGRLAGYGVIRPARQGYKIGPLFADNGRIASQLFAGLQSRVTAGADLFIDVPLCNEQAVRLVEGEGMKPVFETARMYTGEPPALNTQAQFGITSFELG